MLTEEQTEQIKKQLLNQIEENFPEDKKELAISHISKMNSEQIEEFLKQNQIQMNEGAQGQCIFCSILSEEIKSYKIGENEKAIAILEINPISKGHALIIPKEHISEIDEQVKTLSKEVSKKIKTKFKAKQIKIFVSELFNHKILNILPVYKNENPNSKRRKAEPEELEKIQKNLEEDSQKEEKKVRIQKEGKTEEVEEIFSLPKRIP